MARNVVVRIAVEVVGVNVTLLYNTSNLGLDIRVVAVPANVLARLHRPSLVVCRTIYLLKLIITVNQVPFVSIAFADLVLHILKLLAGDAAPMLPPPAAMAGVGNLEPGAEAQVALHTFGTAGLADLVLAAGAVVLGDL